MTSHAGLDRAHVPLRTCVGCRRRGPVSEVLRVVAIASADGFALRPDFCRTMPGRGAHLHPETGCLSLALRRRAFGRALRVTGVIDAGELEEAISRPVTAGVKTVGGASAPLKE